MAISVRSLPRVSPTNWLAVPLLGLAAACALLLVAQVAPQLAREDSAQPSSASFQPAALSAVFSEHSLARAEAILALPQPERPAPVAAPASAWVVQRPSQANQPGASEQVSPDVRDALALATAAGPTIKPRAAGWQGDFIHAVGMSARSAYGADRIPASVTIAQAIVESDWGRSGLARNANNYFGIKAFGRAGTAGTVTLPTMEYEAGQEVQVDAAFRAYRTLGDSIADHHRFLFENPRYGVALAQGRNPEAFAYGLQRAGYATDPRYAGKLLAIMDQYDLYRYDQR